LQFDPYAVVKTLIMQGKEAQSLMVLMHGNRQVYARQLVRQLGLRKVE